MYYRFQNVAAYNLVIGSLALPKDGPGVASGF